MMKRALSFLVILVFTQTLWAQYTEVINSKRPGFSDSPYSVGTKVYQVEGGLFYKNISNFNYYDFDQTETFEYNSKAFGTDILLRTGQFFEQLEFMLDMAVQSEDRHYTRPTEYNDSGFGFSKLTLGAKYLVYKPKYKDPSKEIRSWKKKHQFDTKRLIPAVAVYAGLNTNLLTELHKNADGISPRFAIFTQNDFTNRLVMITNFIMDKAFTDQAENSYIITLTYTLAERWSVFGENQGFFRKNIPNDYQFGVGGAYLINKNMQADISARMIYDERNDTSYIIGGGISWRLDKHKDKIIKTKTNNDEVGTEKKGFLGGLFAGGLFKKKSGVSSNGEMPDVKTRKAKTRTLEAPVNKKAAKAKKKRNKQLIKEQKKREKAMKKHNKN